MNSSNTKSHWEKVYSTKSPQEVSWTQAFPKFSLEFIQEFALPKDAAIIDVGGGDSKLVDFLLEEGFTNLTVLDISSKAIERAKIRLGKNASRVKWIVSDIRDFEPQESYAVWHDRAAFHFLTEAQEIDRYLTLVRNWVVNGVVMATFSDCGPLKCSGLPVKQYSVVDLQALFNPDFLLLDSSMHDHETPFGTQQNFVFAQFGRK